MSCKQITGYNSFYHNHLYQLAGLGPQQINTHGEITHGVNAFWPLHTQFLILKKVPLFQQLGWLYALTTGYHRMINTFQFFL